MIRTSTRSYLLAASLVWMIGGVQAAQPDVPAGHRQKINTADLAAAPSGFEENKGQVHTAAGEAAPFVRYRLRQGNTTIFLLGDGIAYQFDRMHYPEGYAELDQAARRDPDAQEAMEVLGKQVRRETYRMDMLLEGANADARITTEGRSTDHSRYYTQPGPGPGQTPPEVYTYSRVTYHAVYPGIDWVLYTTPKGMKYDFVLHPGADPDNIRLRFKDQEELQLDADGRLIHGNRMGRFTEERPVSFQQGKEVGTRFVLDGDRLSFALDDYDSSAPLTIDPDRIWATYYGAAPFDWGMSCSVAADGSVYLAGDTRSSNAIADGGHQETIGDTLRDAFLVKFTADGVRQWGTYYGGSGEDYCLATAVDAGGNVFMAGYTNSPEGMASGGFLNTFAGVWDAFLVKFNSDGVRQWGTYYGGAGSDQAYGGTLDSEGNFYLVGGTLSGSGIASGGFQNGPAGDSDAFLAKFNTDGERLWATYYGGPGGDFAMACATGEGSVYLAGQTTSTSGIALWWGQQTTLGGWADAFLVKFNSSGEREWATYYGGPLFERGNSCAVDAMGNVYMAGHTTGSDTSIAYNGYQNVRAGSNDAYLVKFSSGGVREWGTYFGGPSWENNGTCTVDAVGNVYLAGTTTSTSGIANGGYQDTFGGSFDAFLAYFHPDGALQWSTYYGGSDYDTNSFCAADGNGNVYMAGYSKSTDGIASAGYQNTLGGGADAYLAKFSGGEVPNAISPSTVSSRSPFTIWPNPNTGDRFFLQADATGSAEVRIFDALGKLISTKQVQLAPDRPAVDVEWGSSLVTGLYMVQVTMGGHTMAAPLLVE